MDEEEFAPPFEPDTPPPNNNSPITHYCVSPTNGRLEWLQATIHPKHLNTGTPISPSLSDFLLAGDKNPMDKPALILHSSLGGKGDDVFNVFLEGRSFDRDTFDNELESTVYHTLKDVSESSPPAVFTLKFLFKNSVVTRPYKLAYQIQLPGGDVIENELANV